jgi:hypothetical protein
MLLFYSGHAGMDLLWGEVGANAQAFTIAIAAEGVATLVLSNFIERQGPYRCVLYSTMFAAPAWAFACLGTWKQEKLIVYILFGIPLGIAGAFGFVGTSGPSCTPSLLMIGRWTRRVCRVRCKHAEMVS